MNKDLDRLINKLVSEIQEADKVVSGMIILSAGEDLCVSLNGPAKLLGENLLNTALNDPMFADVLLRAADAFLTIKETEAEVDLAVKELIEKTLGHKK